MRILVTGVNGFIGSHVCDKLKKTHDIIGIGTKSKSSVSGIEYHKVNIESLSSVLEIKEKIKSCDMIIHLAATINSDNFADSIIDINIKGTIHLLHLSKELGVKKIIYISSLPVIGEPDVLPITEEHKNKPNSLYHISKLASEHIITMGLQYNIKPIILRIPSPIGIGMNENTILPVILKRCINNEPIIIYGKGQRKQNYIDVNDIAEAVNHSVVTEVEGIYNIASEKTVSNIELANLCKKLTNSTSELIFNGREDPEEDYNWNTSIEKAKEQLSFQPKYSITDTINDLLHYWEEGK